MAATAVTEQTEKQQHQGYKLTIMDPGKVYNKKLRLIGGYLHCDMTTAFKRCVDTFIRNNGLDKPQPAPLRSEEEE